KALSSAMSENNRRIVNSRLATGEAAMVTSAERNIPAACKRGNLEAAESGMRAPQRTGTRDGRHRAVEHGGNGAKEFVLRDADFAIVADRREDRGEHAALVLRSQASQSRQCRIDAAEIAPRREFARWRFERLAERRDAGAESGARVVIAAMPVR